ncbi:MAG: FAD binding domain-containing protein [Deltaproteobacteria bacterium]|nr:FAD binding domain-containing protein [Deltaproteobacteria bacterium]
MLQNTKVCLYPRDPEEAVRILSEKGKQALVVAGGTTAALSKDPNVSTLVDITRIGHDQIEQKDDQWLIGCNVRIQQLAEHAGLAELYDGMLVDSAKAVGSRPIRNAVTLGGNVVQLFRWSDPPVALFAMDAEFDLIGPEGRRSLAADDFFKKHPRKVLGASEILTGVRIRKPKQPCGGAFSKYARTAFDLAVVDVAVCLGLEGKKCSNARIVVGATRNVPWRAIAAEELLNGKRLTSSVIEKAAIAARQAVKTADTVRTTREYRQQMVEVIVRRTIEQAAACAKEQ